jgi:hypothetical protein
MTQSGHPLACSAATVMALNQQIVEHRQLAVAKRE